MNPKKVNWNKITSKFIGRPYKFGSWKIEEGLDCLSFLVLIQAELGRIITDEKIKIGRIEKTNYTKWPEKVLSKALIKGIRKHFDKIEPIEVRFGDVVIGTIKGEFAHGIVDSNGQMIVCSKERGVFVAPLELMQIIEYRTYREK